MNDADNGVILEIKAEIVNLRPSLEGIFLELQRQARSSHDARDFIINEFRNLTRAIDGLAAQLTRLS